MINSIFFLALSLTSQAQLPAFDPDLSWKTTETEHFYIHYNSELEEAAKRLAVRVEPVYRRLTTKYHWEPSDVWGAKVHIVLVDHTDDSNGMSTPIPYNTVYLYAVPPTDGSALDIYDDWLTTLFMHEFTHTVHLDMARGFNKILRLLFGRVWVPNAIQQQWGIEGLAVYEETLGTTGGRGRSSFIDMYLRTVAMEDKFLSIDRATYWHDSYPFGNAAYWYGIGFMQYLAEKYGDDKIVELTRVTSEWLIPSVFNFKTKKLFGKSLNRLWDEWALELKEKTKVLTTRYQPTFSSKPISDQQTRLIGVPAWNADGSVLYASVVSENRPKIMAYAKKSDGTFKSEVLKEGMSVEKLFFADNKLYYAEEGASSRYRQSYEIHEYDLEKKKSKQLTRGLRLRDPIVDGESIIAVRTDAYKSQLVRFIPTKEKLTDKTKLEVLYQADGYNTLSKPTLSPDKQMLVFSMKVENGHRDLYWLDMRTKQVQPLTNDSFQDYNPVFSANGQYVLFSSDHPLGNTSTRVFNIFALRLSDKKVFQVSDAWTGVNFPALSGSQLAYGIFHASGFEPSIASFNETALSEATAETVKEDNYQLPPTPPATPDRLEERPYSVGSTLVPRYILPFFFYTESDSAIGAQTSANDPLARHSYAALGYYLTTPARPGGGVSYVYQGWSPAALFFGAGAGMTNYGKVLLSTANTVLPDDYYERNYEVTGGFSRNFLKSDGTPSGFSLSQSLFYAHQSSLLGLPSNAVSGQGTVTITNSDGSKITYNNVRFSPEEGQMWGIRSAFSFGMPSARSVADISPRAGFHLTLSAEYTPKGMGSDFHRLVTILDGKVFWELMQSHVLAFSGMVGNQWLRPMYQRQFLLGGSFGESPFSAINKRNYALRGFSTSELQGEGLAVGSLEYRFPLWRHLPGLGTAPIWFKNLHSAFFFDGGQTFQYQTGTSDSISLIEAILQNQAQKFRFDRFSASTGVELRSDLSLSYAPPLTFRLGYGYVLFKEGDWQGNRRRDQVYFQAGTSF